MTVSNLELPQFLRMRPRQDWNLLPVFADRVDQSYVVRLCLPNPVFDKGRFKLLRLDLHHSLSRGDTSSNSLGVPYEGSEGATHSANRP